MTLKWKRANKTETTNERKESDLIGLSKDTNARGFSLVKRTLGVKKRHPRELSRNQPILRFDVILQDDWPIEQCLRHIRILFSVKTKRPCFDLFIHWLIKQIKNTYRNHFSRSYENRFIVFIIILHTDKNIDIKFKKKMRLGSPRKPIKLVYRTIF